MVFDLIIDYAKKEIEDERLLELINNLKIGNVDEKDLLEEHILNIMITPII